MSAPRGQEAYSRSVHTSDTDWAGHEPGQRGYRRLLFALFLAGVATFSQLYSPQGLLPLISSDLQVSAADAALTVSTATLGLARWG